MKQRVSGMSMACSMVVAVMVSGATILAHNGPPFPVVSNRIAGNYQLSLWADPDVSDDGSADARFWVTVQPARDIAAPPPNTIVTVSVWPLDQPNAVRTEVAGPVEHEPTRWFAAFAIDREGRYGVKASVAGPLGPADVETVVDSVYDQRPQPFTVVLFVLPFLLVGFPVLKWLLRRRRGTTADVISPVGAPRDPV
jgi:hypothetical protein